MLSNKQTLHFATKEKELQHLIQTTFTKYNSSCLVLHSTCVPRNMFIHVASDKTKIQLLLTVIF